MPEVEEMINLAYLTSAERDLILEVLHRDEELRKAEEQRIRKLKSELLDIKKKGAKLGSGRYSERSCGRCQQPLSMLSLSSGQCRACKHNVCRACRSPRSDGSCLCAVCAKEADLKKCTGDWFYDQGVNRFSTKQGVELVRSSLWRPALKKRQATGEILLRSVLEEVPPKSPPLVPVPQPRQNPPAAKEEEEEAVVTRHDSPPPAIITTQSPPHSDADSVDAVSLASRRSEARSPSTSPELTRKEKVSSQSGSSVCSLTVSNKAESFSSQSSSSDARRPSVGPADEAPEVRMDSLRPGRQSPQDNGLFKISLRRRNAPVHVSALDLREEVEEGRGEVQSMGSRSYSVPGLDIQDEEDEDIDSLVNLHKQKQTVGSTDYSRRSSSITMGSTMSLYSSAGDYDSVDVSGEILYTVSYDEHTQSLIVYIKECHDLANGDAARRQCNPYVKCYLLPDKSRHSKRKTATKRNTNNPVFNETLKYPVSRLQLANQTLEIAVWHSGRLSRNTFLGESVVTLDVRDLDSPQEECVALMPKMASLDSAYGQNKGELVISLKYVTPKKPSKAERITGRKTNTEGGELHILIKEAKNLVALKSGGTADPFVKGYLFPQNTKSTKRKTPMVKKNLNPNFDHTFVYKELKLAQLTDMCLELTVWDRDTLSSNEFMGGVRLSTGTGTMTAGKDGVEMDSVGEEVSLWEKMMQYPDSWAEGTLHLRASMGKHAKKGLQAFF